MGARPPITELKLFTDLIDALGNGKVVGGLKALVNLPQAKREFRLCDWNGSRV
jgi:hypothetical protein